MTAAIDSLLSEFPPAATSDDVWTMAIEQADAIAPRNRSGGGGRASDKLQELKELIDKEFVGFHERLIVRPHEGDTTPTVAGAQLWDIEVPLTLFPRRHSGFNRIECVVRLYTEAGGVAAFRVLNIAPAERETLLAKAAFKGKLNTQAKGKLDALNVIPQAGGLVDGELNLSVETGELSLQSTRQCVETEILMGTGARWRLDDTKDNPQLKAESHALGLVLETSADSAPIDAAGYMQAFSSRDWVSRLVSGNFWLNFRGELRAMFDKGLPVEAYAEWTDIFGAQPR